MADWQEPKTPEEAFVRSMVAIQVQRERERTLMADVVALKAAVQEAKVENLALKERLAAARELIPGIQENLDAVEAENRLLKTERDTLAWTAVALRVAIREAKADRGELRGMLLRLLQADAHDGITRQDRIDGEELLAKHPYEEDSGADE